MRRDRTYVNDIVLDKKSENARSVERVKYVKEPETNIKRPIAGTAYDRRCKIKPIHIQAIKTLFAAGWTPRQVSVAMGISVTTIYYHLHVVHKPRKKQSRKTPDYWKERNKAARIYRKQLEEEGLI